MSQKVRPARPATLGIKLVHGYRTQAGWRGIRYNLGTFGQMRTDGGMGYVGFVFQTKVHWMPKFASAISDMEQLLVDEAVGSEGLCRQEVFLRHSDAWKAVTCFCQRQCTQSFQLCRTCTRSLQL